VGVTDAGLALVVLTVEVRTVVDTAAAAVDVVRIVLSCGAGVEAAVDEGVVEAAAATEVEVEAAAAAEDDVEAAAAADDETEDSVLEGASHASSSSSTT
jgi:hypothetical protein